MPLDNEKGYSVYYFGQSNPTEYCIIDQEHQQRQYMNIGAILEVISIMHMFAVPLLLIAVYDNFRAEAKKIRTCVQLCEVSSQCQQ